MRATTARGVKSFGLLAREATGNQGKGLKPGNTQGHEGAGLEREQNKISQASEGCETEGETIQESETMQIMFQENERTEQEGEKMLVDINLIGTTSKGIPEEVGK